MNEYQKTVVDVISRLPIPPSSRIMEVGFGRGGYTRLLRYAVPEGYIVGYDRNERFYWEEAPARKFLSEARCEDVFDAAEQEQESCDLVTFGSANPALLFWWHFNCFSLGTYKSFVSACDRCCKQGGFLVAFFKLARCESPGQECYVRALEFMCEAECLRRGVSYQIPGGTDILEETADILRKSGSYSLQGEAFMNNGSPPRMVMCREFLESLDHRRRGRKKGSMFPRDSMFPDDLWRRAKELDARSFNYGQEFGYSGVLVAKKTRRGEHDGFTVPDEVLW